MTEYIVDRENVFPYGFQREEKAIVKRVLNMKAVKQ